VQAASFGGPPGPLLAAHSAFAAGAVFERSRVTAVSEDPEMLHRFEEALANLPPVQREIFLAHRLDDMSYAEIACRTGLSVEQVERQMARAIYRLCKQMDGHRLSLWERWF
jgi:RNA polymerase sigma-70 factor (ECF subfamily)